MRRKLEFLQAVEKKSLTKKIISGFVLGISVLSTSASDLYLSKEECEVWQRENDFAKSVANHNIDEFKKFINPVAVFSAASPQPTRGRDAIVNNWQTFLIGKQKKLFWRAQFVSIGENSNVAISRGPYGIATLGDDGKWHYGIGNFVSVWTKVSSTAPWIVMFDGGGPPATKVETENEMNSYVDGVPSHCLVR